MDVSVLTERLDRLRQEFQSGQQMLAELENRQQDLRTTLLRISGAIQVVEELIAKEAPEALDKQASDKNPVDIGAVA